ncbi:DUF2752 domain-containing protein [Mucilaginibacter paludis]|uniref:DUF2752 domain-containing protein n=1 Tax=Mucilaginibacter paludis DSM 18603 TaxID=714943 RepID=H1Y4Y2_9SPHI|nr:DUF2752 domain-containing protein [Mucilaginibacter paludis]EHQ28310.1 hypothetical protein Mucpa_4219 [Mucilaginibacter paludis DSM 18603]
MQTIVLVLPTIKSHLILNHKLLSHSILFCNHMDLFQWLQNHLIPCPFKKLTGIDCPGCGFQRSFIALMRGDFHQSFALYPATIPLLLTTAYVILNTKLHIDKKYIATKIIYMLTGSIILGSYLIKIYYHYNT